MTERKYTVNEIREAAELAVRNAGNQTNALRERYDDQDLVRIALELAEARPEFNYYRITQNDAQSYLDMRDVEPCPKTAQTFFNQSVRYLQNSETMGETVSLCFDEAYREATAGNCQCPECLEREQENGNDNNEGAVDSEE